jgi:hypothetical protein
MLRAHDRAMKLRTAIATATTAAILATSGVALAGATTNSGTHPSATASPSAAVKTTVRRPAVSAARLRLRLRIRKGAAAVITKTIGIDRKTLRADLASGQTIAQIATAKGVAPQTVIDALVAAATSKLDAAVSAHKITAARATKIEQKLPDRAAKLVNTWHPKRLKTTAS